jgi:tetratricopeptide (TPR) repeat protein
MESNLVRVVYENNLGSVVDDVTLEELILTNRIIKFYRPSQGKWINIKNDSVRLGDYLYQGPERRSHHEEEKPLAQEKSHGLLSRIFMRRRIPAAKKDLTAQEWFEKGFGAFHDEDDDEKALRAYAKCIHLDPANQRAYFQRGVAYQKVGNLHQAINDYSKAIILAPGDAKVYYMRGIARLRLNMVKEAKDDMERSAGLGYRLAINFLKPNEI